MSEELLSIIHAELLEQKGALSGLTADMKTLVGNGKQGRIDRLEDNVEDLLADKNRRLGYFGAFAAIVAGWEVLKHFLRIS